MARKQLSIKSPGGQQHVLVMQNGGCGLGYITIGAARGIKEVILLYSAVVRLHVEYGMQSGAHQS